LRDGVAARTAGKQYSNEEDNPAKGHNEPENVFYSEASGGASRGIDEISCQDEHISPEEGTCSLPLYEFPAGVDSHANHGQDTKCVQDDDSDKPCS